MYETMKEALYEENVRCTSCGTIAECFIRDDVKGDIPFCGSCWYLHERGEEGRVISIIEMEE